MIDERALTDPSRCPSCAGPLLGVATCPACRVVLDGEAGARLWQVSSQAAALLGERSRLIATLREDVRRREAPAARAGTALPVVGTAPTTASAPVPASAPAPVPTTAPAPEWTRRRVQNLLLTLGVVLLAVAAVIFLIVSWSVLGVGGRAAVMTGCTVLAGGGAALAHRRGLTSTSEAVSLLTVGLGLLDAWGARRAGLAGLDDVAGLPYWAGALAVLAALAAAAALVVPTRGFRVPAAALAQLPVVLVTVHLARSSEQPAAIVATGLTLAAVAALAATAGWPGGTRSRDARLVVAAGGGLAWLSAGFAALVAAYAEAGSLVPGSAMLLVLAGVAVAAVLLGTSRPWVAAPASAAATALLIAAVWATPADQTGQPWLPVVLALAALTVLVGTALLPLDGRPAPAMVALLATVAPAAVLVEPVAVTIAGQLSWLDRAWTGAGTQPARAMLAVDGLDLGLGPVAVSAAGPLLLLTVALALVVADRLHPRLAALHLGAVPALALAALLSPAALDTSFSVAVGVDQLAAALLVVGGAACLRTAGRLRHLGWVALASGLAVLTLAVAWSFAVDETTLVALPMTALALAAATAVSGTTVPRPLRVALGAGAGLAAVAEAAAVARYAGAGWPAVWSLALGLALAAAAASAVLLAGHERRGFAVAAAAFGLADVAALATWAGVSPASAGLSVAVAAAVLLAAAVWVDQVGRVGRVGRLSITGPDLATIGDDVALTCAAGAVAGVAASALDPDRLWVALLAVGVAVAVAAFRPNLHKVGWVAGVLLTASSWVRLTGSDVDAPEPYTVPAGLALLVLGAWRRRRETSYPSWHAYGTGLVLCLGPSLVRALVDDGNLRPMLLGLAALVVLVSGVARRLQAPLAVGGLVLAADAIVQLSPYLAALYAAVPRWSLIATVGLLLLVFGATYERRARELRALQQQIARFG